MPAFDASLWAASTGGGALPSTGFCGPVAPSTNSGFAPLLDETGGGAGIVPLSRVFDAVGTTGLGGIGARVFGAGEGSAGVTDVFGRGGSLGGGMGFVGSSRIDSGATLTGGAPIMCRPTASVSVGVRKAEGPSGGRTRPS